MAAWTMARASWAAGDGAGRTSTSRARSRRRRDIGAIIARPRRHAPTRGAGRGRVGFPTRPSAVRADFVSHPRHGVYSYLAAGTHVRDAHLLHTSVRTDPRDQRQCEPHGNL